MQTSPTRLRDSIRRRRRHLRYALEQLDHLALRHPSGRTTVQRLRVERLRVPGPAFARVLRSAQVPPKFLIAALAHAGFWYWRYRSTNSPTVIAALVAALACFTSPAGSPPSFTAEISLPASVRAFANGTLSGSPSVCFRISPLLVRYCTNHDRAPVARQRTAEAGQVIRPVDDLGLALRAHERWRGPPVQRDGGQCDLRGLGSNPWLCSCAKQHNSSGLAQAERPLRRLRVPRGLRRIRARAFTVLGDWLEEDPAAATCRPDTAWWCRTAGHWLARWRGTQGKGRCPRGHRA